MELQTIDIETLVRMAGVIIALVQAVMGSAAVGGLASVVTDILKTFGVVEDKRAPLAVTIIGGVLLALIGALLYFNRETPTVEQLEAVAILASNLLVALVAVAGMVVGMFAGAKGTHAALKGVPMIGKSRTFEVEQVAKAKEAGAVLKS